MSATESKAQLENQTLSVATYKLGLHPCKNLQLCAATAFFMVLFHVAAIQ